MIQIIPNKIQLKIGIKGLLQKKALDQAEQLLLNQSDTHHKIHKILFRTNIIQLNQRKKNKRVKRKNSTIY